jgi:hypothetical protein
MMNSPHKLVQPTFGAFTNNMACHGLNEVIDKLGLHSLPIHQHFQQSTQHIYLLYYTEKGQAFSSHARRDLHHNVILQLKSMSSLNQLEENTGDICNTPSPRILEEQAANLVFILCPFT